MEPPSFAPGIRTKAAGPQALLLGWGPVLTAAALSLAQGAAGLRPAGPEPLPVLLDGRAAQSGCIDVRLGRGCREPYGATGQPSSWAGLHRPAAGKVGPAGSCRGGTRLLGGKAGGKRAVHVGAREPREKGGCRCFPSRPFWAPGSCRFLPRPCSPAGGAWRQW